MTGTATLVQLTKGGFLLAVDPPFPRRWSGGQQVVNQHGEGLVATHLAVDMGTGAVTVYLAEATGYLVDYTPLASLQGDDLAQALVDWLASEGYSYQG